MASPSTPPSTDDAGAQGPTVASSAHPVPRALRSLWRIPIIRVSMISVIATLLNYLITLAISAALPAGGLFAALAVTIGYLSGVYLNFDLSRRWVFGASKYVIGLEFTMVLLVYLSGYGVTLAVTLLLQHLLRLPLALAYPPALIISFLWTYYLRLFLIYRRKAPPDTQDRDAA